MTFVLAVLFILSLGNESYAFWSFGPKKVYPQNVCGSIGDSKIKERCMASFFNTKNKTSEKQKLLPLCLNLSDKINKLAENLKKDHWGYVVDCLDQIGKIKESDFPDQQIKFCHTLISKSRSAEFSLPCLEKFNPNILEICNLPLIKGSYKFTADCLKATQGYELDPSQVALQVADLKRCTEADKSQQMNAASWETFAGCLQNKLEAIEGNPVRSRYNPDAPSSITGGAQK